MTLKPITVASLVALAWIALVAFYVLNGLGPHGYIDGVADAVWTALAWLVAGGFVLGWLVRRLLPDTGTLRAVGRVGGPDKEATAQGDAASADGRPGGRDEAGQEEDPYWNPTYATSINNAWRHGH
ncbi:MAG TPA: hypothetical protein PKN30_16560 [Flavobacteriales bacterium]|nr:hypothetical protein [Flavobacteriales bacterium]